MNQQAMNNIPKFTSELRKAANAVHLACDPGPAADISLKLEKAAKALDELRQQQQWIFDNCKVVYHPDTDKYPIEHNPSANKDSRDDLMLLAGGL